MSSPSLWGGQDLPWTGMGVEPILPGACSHSSSGWLPVLQLDTGPLGRGRDLGRAAGCLSYAGSVQGLCWPAAPLPPLCLPLPCCLLMGFGRTPFSQMGGRASWVSAIPSFVILWSWSPGLWNYCGPVMLTSETVLITKLPGKSSASLEISLC